MITAHLGRAFVAYDQWSPAIDSMMQLFLLEEKGLKFGRPSVEDIIEGEPLMESITPLAKHRLGDVQVWAASAPHYELKAQQTTTYYKRWTGHETGLNWGKAKPKWNESAGLFKNYNLPNFGRVAQFIHWFVLGDRAELTRIFTVSNFPAIGKKTSQGNGMVLNWSVTPIAEDASLVCAGKLARIVPATAASHLPESAIAGCPIAHRTWHPPYWMVHFATDCIMPIDNVAIADERNRA